MSSFSPEVYLEKLSRTEPDQYYECPWQELEQLVVLLRLERYNRCLPCGPRALREHLDLYEGIINLPSERTIARWLSKHGLTHGRTGWYPGEDNLYRICK